MMDSGRHTITVRNLSHGLNLTGQVKTTLCITHTTPGRI